MEDNETVEVEVSDNDTNFELAQGIVQNIVADKPADAMDQVNDLMLDKVRDAIAGKRQEVAASLFGEPQADDEADVDEPEEVELETEADSEVEETDGDVEEFEVVDDESETETEEEDEDVQTD
jgi:hypothetical protein